LLRYLKFRNKNKFKENYGYPKNNSTVYSVSVPGPKQLNPLSKIETFVKNQSFCQTIFISIYLLGGYEESVWNNLNLKRMFEKKLQK